jgi:hypothetical protein
VRIQMMPCSVFRVLGGVHMVRMRYVRVVRGLLVISLVMRAGSFVVMMGGLGVMMSRLGVMMRCLF